jgi:Na+-translocating ferredoxin:NAD+ oxidoreductase RnfG subunit
MNPWITFLVPPAMIAAADCLAVQYLTVEQAQRVLFPDASDFEARPVVLDSAQIAAIESATGVAVRTPRHDVWAARRDAALRGWFVVDEVIGKHELITYALALSPEGRILGIEVLAYRENYGYEIRNPAWRAQFAGKSRADALTLDSDIRNITGATLSCRHVTEGVRRLLAVHALALR